MKYYHSFRQFLRWHVHSPTAAVIQVITFTEMMNISSYFTHSLFTQKTNTKQNVDLGSSPNVVSDKTLND